MQKCIVIAFVYKLVILIESVLHKECGAILTSRVEPVVLHMMQVNKLSSFGRKKKLLLCVQKLGNTTDAMGLLDYSISSVKVAAVRRGQRGGSHVLRHSISLHLNGKKTKKKYPGHNYPFEQSISG